MNKFYQINNKADGAEILIYEQIGKNFNGDGVGAKTFVDDLKPFRGKPLTVRINSPGGNVFDASAIYSTLKAHNAPVIVKIDGVAASAASVIAMAGNQVIMPENALMMIHDPWGLAVGTVEDLQKQIVALTKVKETIISTYHNKTQLQRSNIDKMMKDETWMTAEEAKEYGFADVVSESKQYQASFSLLKDFNNTPRKLITDRTINMNQPQNSNHSDRPQEQELRQKWNSMTQKEQTEYVEFENFYHYHVDVPGVRVRTAGSNTRGI